MTEYSILTDPAMADYVKATEDKLKEIVRLIKLDTVDVDQAAKVLNGVVLRSTEHGIRCGIELQHGYTSGVGLDVFGGE